jgi:hypothetical protein
MVHAGSPLRLQPIHCSYIRENNTDKNDLGSAATTPVTSTFAMITEGRLYIGNDAILFIGTQKSQRRHFFASTYEHLIITLPWMTILRIQPKMSHQNNTNAPDPVGVRIRTKGDTTVRGDAVIEENIYDFGRIETPEQVWASLVAIHNDKLLHRSSLSDGTPKPSKLPVGVSIHSGSKTTAGHPAKQETIMSSSQRRKSHRRTNSDPMMASIQLNFDNYQVLHNVLNDNDTGTLKESVPNSNDTNLNATLTTLGKKDPAITTAGKAYSDLWTSMKNQSTTNVYSDIVIDSEVIENCTLDQFYNTFLNNSAMYSMERFLIGRGDFDVQTSDWEDDITTVETTLAVADFAANDLNGGWKQYKRVIKYMHPVNVPLAPPQAAARKEQILTRYNDAGICIVTQTYVDDVPMTDCFYVADRMLVEPSLTILGGITIRMEFGITFVKSTMFKGIISKKTTAEFIELFKALAQYISNAIIDMNSVPVIQNVDEADSQTTKDEDNTPDVTKNQQPMTTRTAAPNPFFTIDRMILIFIIIIQIWIVMELKGMKHAIALLGQQQQCSNNSI